MNGSENSHQPSARERRSAVAKIAGLDVDLMGPRIRVPEIETVIHAPGRPIVGVQSVPRQHVIRRNGAVPGSNR